MSQTVWQHSQILAPTSLKEKGQKPRKGNEAIPKDKGSSLSPSPPESPYAPVQEAGTPAHGSPERAYDSWHARFQPHRKFQLLAEASDNDKGSGPPGEPPPPRTTKNEHVICTKRYTPKQTNLQHSCIVPAQPPHHLLTKLLHVQKQVNESDNRDPRALASHTNHLTRVEEEGRVVESGEAEKNGVNTSKNIDNRRGNRGKGPPTGQT